MDALEEEMMGGGGDAVNFIPCLAWVARGRAKANPEKVELSKEELAKVIAATKDSLRVVTNEDDDDDDDGGGDKEEEDDGSQDVMETNDAKDNEEMSVEDRYDLHNYDDEDGSKANLMNLGDFVDLDDDFDGKLNLNDDDDDDQDSDDSETEDMTLKPTDNLILVGHVEGNAAILEVYVYNDVEGDLYVHHDLLLPSPPLALEWLSYEPGQDSKGNLVAVGSMDSVVQVWDVDLVDCLEPAFELGAAAKKDKKSSKKKGKKKPDPMQGHSDAVLSLAWNHHVEHVLASGSVDERVLLWDLSQGTVATVLNGHKEKIQALAWHPCEAQTLLTGCCDQAVRVYDCRESERYRHWKTDGEVEAVVWNHFDPYTFFASTDEGNVVKVDVRDTSKPLFTHIAHSAGVNALMLSPQCPDLLVTASSDGYVRVWDANNNEMLLVREQEMKLGVLHCLKGCMDAPFVFCVGGDNRQDNLKVMDVREWPEVRRRFGERRLQNPLELTSFGFDTLNEAEKSLMEEREKNLASMADNSARNGSVAGYKKGGAAAKFASKERKE